MGDLPTTTDRRPPKASPDVVARLSKLGTVSRCLEEALSDLVREEANPATNAAAAHTSSDDGVPVDPATNAAAATVGIERRVPPSPPPPSPSVISAGFGSRLVEKYGEAIAEIEWDDRHAPPTEIDGDRTSTTKPPPSLPPPPSVPRPPAAVLSGTLGYYNRIGRQWRIVVSRGEIRRRVGFAYGGVEEEEGGRNGRRNQKRKNEDSLWEQSVGRGRGERDVVRFDGPLLVLAYDDV